MPDPLSPSTARRRRLLAGSYGPERIPLRPDPDDSDWYLPLHIRRERAARERIAAQVAAGADVIVAPTWLTHRRALLPLGETRRAGAWTTAAVRLAHDAREVGLERRAEGLADTPLDDPNRTRPLPLVAAVLPTLDEREPESGRLLPREAASERDYRDQAGLLADAGPDLLLVEGQPTEGDARRAIHAAVDTGLRVWSALTASALAAVGLEGWCEWAADAGVECLLLPHIPQPEPAAGDELRWGGLADDATPISEWLSAGADAIALLDGATAQKVEQIRAVVDDHERASHELARGAARRWREHVERAASAAPGGAAAWIGDPPDWPLPGGFAWQFVDPAEVSQLPREHYRLVVMAGPMRSGTDLGLALDHGGLLIGPASTQPALRLLNLLDEAQPALAIHRREV